MSVVMRAQKCEAIPLQVGSHPPGVRRVRGLSLGLVAQLVERCPCTAEATGSNPVESIAEKIRLGSVHLR